MRLFCLAQSGKPRTVIPALASGILNAESAGAGVYFFADGVDHEIASTAIMRW